MYTRPCNTQHVYQTFQHTTCIPDLATYNMYTRPCNIQNAYQTLQHTTCIPDLATHNMYFRPCNTQQVFQHIFLFLHTKPLSQKSNYPPSPLLLLGRPSAWKAWHSLTSYKSVCVSQVQAHQPLFLRSSSSHLPPCHHHTITGLTTPQPRSALVAAWWRL